MSRQNAREAAVRFLYQSEITGQSPMEAMEDYFRNIQPDDEDCYLPMNDKDIDYAKSVIEGVSHKIDEIDGCVSLNSKDWKINRISKTLLSIMRVAVFEMLYIEDVPVKVSLDEAIELAKAYDGDSAGPFVNGVLGGVVKQHKLCD